jgi:hypothetical protein
MSNLRLNTIEKTYLSVLGLGFVAAIATAPLFGLWPVLGWLLAVIMLAASSRSLDWLAASR